MPSSGYLFGQQSCHCGQVDCCAGWSADDLSLATAAYGNHTLGGCCAYLVVTVYDAAAEFSNEVPVPIGLGGVGVPVCWGTYVLSPGCCFYSWCETSFYLDWLAAGSPTIEAEPNHPYHTTTSRSIIVKVYNTGADPETDYILVECFMNSSCCVTSIQTAEFGTIDPDITSIVLSTTPQEIPDFFSDRLPGGPEDILYLCADPPNGACCVDGMFVDNTEARPCLEGFYGTPASWLADGTYDPEDPCNPLP